MFPAKIRGFSLEWLTENDPRVQDRLESFHKKLGLVKPWRHPDVKWFGLIKDGIIACAVSIFIRPDSSLEIIDYYPAPTRDGVRAGYAGLYLLKAMVDEKIVPYWIGPIPRVNGFGLRHVEKFFGIKPRCMVYVYGGEGS